MHAPATLNFEYTEELDQFKFELVQGSIRSMFVGDASTAGRSEWDKLIAAVETSDKEHGYYIILDDYAGTTFVIEIGEATKYQVSLTLSAGDYTSVLVVPPECAIVALKAARERLAK